MAESSSLFLEAPDKCVVKVHPTVLFAILDHYLRRSEGQTRVIGTLLGKDNDGVVEVHNCYPVPHIEKEEEVAVGKDFNKQMFALHHQVNPSEEIVGWYATTLGGQMITDHSITIHNFYGAECRTRPIHMVVDTSLAQNNLSITSFRTTPLALRSKTLAAQFREIETAVTYSKAEHIGIDTILRAEEEQMTAGAEKGASAGSTLADDITGIEQSINKMYGMLCRTCDYVDRVVAGDLPMDHVIGQELADCASAVPHIDAGKFENMFNSSVQDLLMVSYLSKLTQTQLAIAEKLHTTM